MAGPSAPWDLCLLRPLALALWPRALRGFPEPRPCPLTARPEGQPRPGVGGSLRLGWYPSHWAQEMESREVRWRPHGGPWGVEDIVGDPVLRSALALVGLKCWLLRFSSSLLQPGVKE